jgi:hypothetical protein
MGSKPLHVLEEALVPTPPAAPSAFRHGTRDAAGAWLKRLCLRHERSSVDMLFGLLRGQRKRADMTVRMGSSQGPGLGGGLQPFLPPGSANLSGNRPTLPRAGEHCQSGKESDRLILPRGADGAEQPQAFGWQRTLQF